MDGWTDDDDDDDDDDAVRMGLTLTDKRGFQFFARNRSSQTTCRKRREEAFDWRRSD